MDGVTTDSDGRVAELVLWDNQLTGPIPAELGNLTNLNELYLSGNQLTGPIPAELANLTNLSNLDLGGNELTGPIPAELGNLTNLEYLELGGNQLTGCVPIGLRDVAEENDLGELGLPDCGFEGRATAIRVGADVRGALDYDGDIDYFRFTAKEGQLYQIDVALGTLDDSIVDLFDSDGSFLDTNDDRGSALASRLFWEAPSSGERYVAVEGYDTGTYTLTVSLITDDHANSEGRATAIRVGADVRGALDYDGDIDYFRFTAKEGQLYQIDVALGTLDDSIVDLFDSDGSFLDTNDDRGSALAARLFWEAPSSGERYVAVDGYGTGTYTLTVSLPGRLVDTADDDGSVASDRAALVALYNATGGPGWIARTNWLSGRPLDEWFGVITDSAGRVAELVLWDNQLTGPIPAELGDLTNLRVLYLGFNELTGPIPAELGNLTNLNELYLSGNQLTGPIPAELGNLTNLSNLDLGGNQLTGPIPAWLGNLTNLVYLGLIGNELTGPIPAELGNLTNLRQLYLDSNRLRGSIPAELGDLTNLSNLDLGGNQLTGPIPAGLGNLTNLNELDLSVNQLTGPIPAWLGNLTNLSWLDLEAKQLKGPIPVWLGNLTNLEYLFLGFNELTGPIPAELGNLTNLSWLYLGGDQLTGPIPAELGDLTNLVELGLWENQLTGPIPAELGNLTNLGGLYLWDNQLTGPIPAELGNLTNLYELDLSGNQLTGPIPAELGNLEHLDLSGNELTGPNTADDGGSVASDRAALVAFYNATKGASWITRTNWLSGRPLDEWHGVTTNSDGRVTGLWLSENQLTGPIPAELGDLTNLVYLGLADNELTGPIPAELGDLINLGWLILGENQLTGPIPAALGDLIHLGWLELWGNELTGPIPAALGDLTNLVTLFLSGNELTGCVPVGLRDVAEDNDLGELGLPDCGFEGRATEIRVGADVRGALDYDGDIDYFRLFARQGRSYQIDVALGTLDDSIVSLYGDDGSFLDSNDDYGDTFASRLFWEAPSSGERYVAVDGYGTGTYTLTVSIVDDHGDDFESATRIAVGDAIAIELEDRDESDVLVFLAEPGTKYVFTLNWENYNRWDDPAGPIMALFDAEGQELARLRNYDFSQNSIRNKIVWQAVTRGDYYVVVGNGVILGSFALTVTVR